MLWRGVACGGMGWEGHAKRGDPLGSASLRAEAEFACPGESHAAGRFWLTCCPVAAAKQRSAMAVKLGNAVSLVCTVWFPSGFW